MSEQNEALFAAADPKLKELDYLTGEWDLTGVTLDGPMGPGGPLTGTFSVSWLGEYFLVFKYESTFNVGGQAVTDSGYEFFDINPENGKFRTRFFNTFGPYDDAGSSYEGDFEDRTLVLTGPARIKRTLNDDGTIAYDTDLEGPDGYVTCMQGTLTKR